MLVLVCVVQPVASFTGKVGFLARLSGVDGTSLGWFWKRVTAAGLLAVHHANTRNPVLVPAAADLPPGFNVTYSMLDTESNPPIGVKITLDMTQAGAHAMVGAVRSAVSGPASLVAGVFNIPVISYASTAKELADKLSYPSFSRTCPSDALTAFAMVSAVVDLNWRSVAIIAMDDAYGRGFAQDLESSCAQLGVDVVANVRYLVNDDQTMDDAISGVAKSGARVFLLVVFESDLYDIVETANRYGLIGKGYSWFVGDSVQDPVNLVLETPDQTIDFGKLIQGFMTIAAGTLGVEKQQVFQAVWNAQDKRDVFDPIFGDVSEAFELEGFVFSLHAHMYEAVWAAVLAMSKSYVTDPNGQQTMDLVALNSNVSFPSYPSFSSSPSHTHHLYPSLPSLPSSILPKPQRSTHADSHFFPLNPPPHTHTQLAL